MYKIIIIIHLLTVAMEPDLIPYPTQPQVTLTDDKISSQVIKLRMTDQVRELQTVLRDRWVDLAWLSVFLVGWLARHVQYWYL